MPVHSLHIFDRKGKTLYTKCFVKDSNENDKPEQLSEQRKLVFGMLFSLREVAASLSPELPPPQPPRSSNNNSNNNATTTPDKDTGLHSVRTAATTLYNYETNSGLKFALYLTNNPTLDQSKSNKLNSDDSSTMSGAAGGSGGGGNTVGGALDTSVRAALEYIYNELWISCVIQSPLYRPTHPNVEETNFETKLISFLKAQPWFR